MIRFTRTRDAGKQNVKMISRLPFRQTIFSVILNQPGLSWITNARSITEMKTATISEIIITKDVIF